MLLLSPDRAGTNTLSACRLPPVQPHAAAAILAPFPRQAPRCAPGSGGLFGLGSLWVHWGGG